MAGTEERDGWRFETQALHAGQAPDPTTGARALPIYQTTSFVFDRPRARRRPLRLTRFGNIYTRLMNPTNSVFEARMAALEGGVAGVAMLPGRPPSRLRCSTSWGPGAHRLVGQHLRRHVQRSSATRCQAGHRGRLRRRLAIPRTSAGPSSPETRAVYGEIGGQPAVWIPSTSRRWRTSPTRPACRSSSTTPRRPPTWCARWTMAPTSS